MYCSRTEAVDLSTFILQVLALFFLSANISIYLSFGKIKSRMLNFTFCSYLAYQRRIAVYNYPLNYSLRYAIIIRKLF